MMISVTQKSENKHLAFKSLEFAGLREDFLIFFNKLPFLRPFCLPSHFIRYILLEAKCLLLDSNFIAYNLRGRIGLRHFFTYRTIFYL